MSTVTDDDEEFMRDRAYAICYQRRQLQVRFEDLSKLVNRALVVTLPYHHDQRIAEVLLRMQKHIARIGKCFEWDDEKADPFQLAYCPIKLITGYACSLRVSACRMLTGYFHVWSKR